MDKQWHSPDLLSENITSDWACVASWHRGGGAISVDSQAGGTPGARLFISMIRRKWKGILPG